MTARQGEVVRLSHYQQRIIEFVATGRGHGVVQATAGAGKTSTLVQVAAHIPPHLRACFLAFGRDAASELSRRLPPTVAAMTVHKLGRRTLEQALRWRAVRLKKVDRGKYQRLLRNELRGDHGLEDSERAECEEYLSSLVNLVRLNLSDANDDDELRRLTLRYNVVPPRAELEPLAHRFLRTILHAGAQEALELGLTDFTDMIYLPVTQSLTPPRFDFVCVDEAQDYSALALAFTMRLVDEGQGGRLLFVGDPRQSIYGFAGADSEALERIERVARATVLPLSITYRCPRSHVALAQLIAPEIEAGPAATEGKVFWIADDVLEHWAREGDMILCRANAPLVRTCLRLVRAGRRALVRGRDLRRQLIELSRRALAGAAPDTRRALEVFARNEEARLRRALKGRPHEEALVGDRLDLIRCLCFLAEDLTQPTELVAPELAERIEHAFGDSQDAVILSTIHRAKGQEADRILLLYPELMPAPYARTSDALRGEACVQFVALTRARHELVFVAELGQWPLEERVPARERPRENSGLSMEDSIGQGQGVWRDVLALAKLLARRRG
ncbi:MAG: UvrD-helicase domain-containing protein [Trueperaceae bacterium]